MQIARLTFLAVLPALAGCATVGMMRALPPDAGRVAHYAASPDTLAAAAEAAARQQGFAVAEVTRPDTATVMVIGQKHGLFSDGEYVRLRIARDTGELTAVRIVSRPGDLVELWPRQRAPRLFQAMDTQLGPQAMGPWPGMRVRAAPRGGAPIVGNVVRVSNDTIVLQPGGGVAPQPFAVGDLGRLAVSRGSYSHPKAGALIGLVVGGVVGAAIGGSSTDEPYAGLGVGLGIGIGGVAGALLGGVVGSGTRTEVWSDVPRSPRH